MKPWLSAIGLAVLVLWGCDGKSRVTDAGNPAQGKGAGNSKAETPGQLQGVGSFKVAVSIPAEAAAQVARIEYTVSGADMLPLAGEGTLDPDNVVRLTIKGVKAGLGRTVELAAYDSSGTRTYAGSATVDVAVGETASAEVVLRKVASALTATLLGGVSMEMVWIAPGTFMMGSPDSDSLASGDERPQHQVTLTQGFYLGKYEITQGQWEAVMGTQPWSGHSNVQANPNNPAVDISWDDLQVFVDKLNQAAGASLYRLPTEAEWEYACRAGTTTRWSFGDDSSQLGDYAWYQDNSEVVGVFYVHTAGTKKPNPWGLFDMHGNVEEWVQDGSWAYSGSAQTDPLGPGTIYRVFRGGSFVDPAWVTRSAERSAFTPDYRLNYLGARLLRTQ